MDLWIRTQDGKALYDAKQIRINGLDIMCLNGELLGTYKSKERALEVLDDIDNVKFYKYMASLDIKIFVTSIEKKYSQEEQQFLFNQMNTYEMPKE